MTKCKNCGAWDNETALLPLHEDTLLGAPFTIVLENVVSETKCAACGSLKGLIYHNLEGLIAAVAMVRALYPEKLWPEEVKFLRKAIGWKQTQVAKKMQKSAESISRWETGALTMAPDAEKHFRLHVCLALWEEAPLVHFNPEELSDLQIRPVRAVDSELIMRCWPARRSEMAPLEKWGADIKSKVA
jgi:transcriptional regulator with XRE-family HTH domain